MSEHTFAAASYVLMPIRELDKVRRITECSSTFLIEVTGPDAAKAMAVLPEPEQVLAGRPAPTRHVKVSDTHWRVYKSTKLTVRHDMDRLFRWSQQNPDLDFDIEISSDEWTTKQYGDAVLDTPVSSHLSHLVLDLNEGSWSLETEMRGGKLAEIKLVNASAPKKAAPKKAAPKKAAPKKAAPKRAPAKAKGAKK